MLNHVKTSFRMWFNPEFALVSSNLSCLTPIPFFLPILLRSPAKTKGAAAIALAGGVSEHTI